MNVYRVTIPDVHDKAIGGSADHRGRPKVIRAVVIGGDPRQAANLVDIAGRKRGWFYDNRGTTVDLLGDMTPADDANFDSLIAFEVIGID